MLQLWKKIYYLRFQGKKLKKPLDDHKTIK